MYYCAENIGYDSFAHGYTDMQATRYIQTETYKFIGAMGLKGLGKGPLHISSHLPGFVRFDRIFVSLYLCVKEIIRAYNSPN